MNDVASVALREFGRIWADSRLRSVVFLAPFVYSLLFAGIYSRHSLSEVGIGVWVQDSSAATRQYLRMIDASPRLEIVRRAANGTELEDWIERGEIAAAVIVPRDFTERLKRGHDTAVTAWVDASSMVAANTVIKALTEVTQTFSAGVELQTLMKKGERLSTAYEHFMPVKLDTRSLFNPSFNYTNFMVPGLLIAILQQVILLGVALSWTGEREGGTLGQLFALTRAPWKILLGKAIPYVLINAIVAEFFLRAIFPLFEIPMEGAWWLTVPFTFLFILTIVSWGLWVSCLFRTRLFATQMLMFVALPSFILSGFTWPREAMPAFFRALGGALPLTYFVTSFRAVYLAGATWAQVYPSVFALLGFLALNFLLGLGILSFQIPRLGRG